MTTDPEDSTRPVAVVSGRFVILAVAVCLRYLGGNLVSAADAAAVAPLR